MNNKHKKTNILLHRSGLEVYSVNGVSSLRFITSMLITHRCQKSIFSSSPLRNSTQSVEKIGFAYILRKQIVKERLTIGRFFNKSDQRWANTQIQNQYFFIQ